MGTATAPTPLPVLRQHRPQRRARQDQGAADTRCDEHDDGTAGGDEAAQWLADERADPPTRTTERVEVGHDLLGTAHDVQQPEQRETEQSPTEGET